MRVRLLALLTIVALLGAACGSRVDEDEATAAEGDLNGGTEAGDEGSDNSSDDEPDDGTVMFGTLESPCGPGDATGETDQGVFDDRIEIATISDPGGPIPGMNQSIFDSMETFVTWCNAQGGVNGRVLDLTLLDAKLTEYRERVLEACDFAFALVGDGGALDELGAQETVDCGLPSVAGFAVSPEKAGSDLMYQAVPNPPYLYKVGAAQWIAEEFPDVVDKAASIWGNIPITEQQQARHVEGYESVGFEFIYQTATQVNEVNYGPVVLAMKDLGVEYLTFTSTYEELVNLQRQMRDQGFEPTVVDLETNMYDIRYPEAGGEAVEGSLVRLSAWPFEEAEDNEAMATYLDLLAETKGDVAPATLGLQSFASALLFATALKELGSDVTREGLVAELQKIDSWDSGGLHGETIPSENIASTCFIMMEVVNGEFVRRYPDEGFACPEDGFAELEGDYGSGARVGEG